MMFSLFFYFLFSYISDSIKFLLLLEKWIYIWRDMRCVFRSASVSFFFCCFLLCKLEEENIRNREEKWKCVWGKKKNILKTQHDEGFMQYIYYIFTYRLKVILLCTFDGIRIYYNVYSYRSVYIQQVQYPLSFSLFLYSSSIWCVRE